MSTENNAGVEVRFTNRPPSYVSKDVIEKAYRAAYRDWRVWIMQLFYIAIFLAQCLSKCVFFLPVAFFYLVVLLSFTNPQHTKEAIVAALKSSEAFSLLATQFFHISVTATIIYFAVVIKADSKSLTNAFEDNVSERVAEKLGVHPDTVIDITKVDPALNT